MSEGHQGSFLGYCAGWVQAWSPHSPCPRLQASTSLTWFFSPSCAWHGVGPTGEEGQTLPILQCSQTGPGMELQVGAGGSLVSDGLSPLDYSPVARSLKEGLVESKAWWGLSVQGPRGQ